jgi:hypothetical protein
LNFIVSFLCFFALFDYSLQAKIEPSNPHFIFCIISPMELASCEFARFSCKAVLIQSALAAHDQMEASAHLKLACEQLMQHEKRWRLAEDEIKQLRDTLMHFEAELRQRDEVVVQLVSRLDAICAQVRIVMRLSSVATGQPSRFFDHDCSVTPARLITC